MTRITGFGVVYKSGARLTYFALFALQHRGQESAGIVTADGNRLERRSAMGHVADVFSRDVLEKLTCDALLEHQRTYLSLALRVRTRGSAAACAPPPLPPHPPPR